MMLAGQVHSGQASGGLFDAMATVRQQSVLEAFEQSPLQLGRQRRHHSDPGACVLKMQRVPHGLLVAPHPSTTAVHSAAIQILPDPSEQHGSHSSKGNSKRERRSSSGDAGPTSTSSSGGGAPPAFTITVDCRAADNTATALWQRMHQLELRNKELEQQLVERMQAVQVSNCSSSGGKRQQQQRDRSSSGGVTSPRAHAELVEPDSPVAMEVEPSCSLGQVLPAAGAAPTPAAHSQQLQEQPQQQPHHSLQQQQQHSESVQLQALDPAGPQRLVHTLRAQVQQLQKELQRQKQLNGMLTG
jgi:hypothetical protein